MSVYGGDKSQLHNGINLAPQRLTDAPIRSNPDEYSPSAYGSCVRARAKHTKLNITATMLSTAAERLTASMASSLEEKRFRERAMSNLWRRERVR